jgi:hypothetical protein
MYKIYLGYFVNNSQINFGFDWLLWHLGVFMLITHMNIWFNLSKKFFMTSSSFLEVDFGLSMIFIELA